MTYQECYDILCHGVPVDISDWDTLIDVIKTSRQCVKLVIDLHKAEFTHICKSDNDVYPSTFSIYARIVAIDDSTVTIDRYQKYGAVYVGRVKIPRRDFERYYKRIKNNV